MLSEDAGGRIALPKPSPKIRLVEVRGHFGRLGRAGSDQRKRLRQVIGRFFKGFRFRCKVVSSIDLLEGLVTEALSR